MNNRKIIWTYSKIKDVDKNQFVKTINHGYNESTDKAYCGFNWRNSDNVIGKPMVEKEEDYNRYITCKKCRKIMSL